MSAINPSDMSAAVNYGLNQERLPLTAPRRPYLVAKAKWDRVVYNVEWYLRQKGIITFAR